MRIAPLRGSRPRPSAGRRRAGPRGGPGQPGTSSSRVRTRGVSVDDDHVAIATRPAPASRAGAATRSPQSSPSSAARATGRRTCDSRTSPRSPARPRRAGGAPAPTWRSSRSRGAGRAAAPGRRARGRGARRRSCRRPRPSRRSRRRAAGWSCSRRRRTRARSPRARAATSVEERVDRHALPGRVELRPAGDAVDVGRDRLAREGAELLPRPRPDARRRSRSRTSTRERERMRRRAGREHREVAGHGLAGRHAGRIGVRVPSPAAKAARDDSSYRFRARHYRSDLNAARSSDAKSAGSSHAAKWPPRSTSLK